MTQPKRKPKAAKAADETEKPVKAKPKPKPKPSRGVKAHLARTYMRRAHRS
jgi:hypothetical protein